MTMPARSLRFAHHALAVLGAAMLASTIGALLLSVVIIFATDRAPGVTWLATMIVLLWLSVFIIMLPGAALALSLVCR